MGAEEFSVFHQNAVFFIDVEKIKPNPYQPRREFDMNRLNELAESIRTYGVLQPIVVTRKEIIKEDGGIGTEYELIAGERRLRASKLAGLREVPALIRATNDDERTKLELAIIENLQREDLNPIDRARAFHQLANEFGFKHTEIGKRVGRSREYVSNTIRILALPDEMQLALTEGKISEGHARPLLMLCDRPEEQTVLFREIMLKKMTVRDAEKISRKIAYDKVRKKERMYDPDIVELEEEARAILGARVMIESRETGGKIEIDFVDDNDLRRILSTLNGRDLRNAPDFNNGAGPQNNIDELEQKSHSEMVNDFEAVYNNGGSDSETNNGGDLSNEFPEDRQTKSDQDDEDMYSIKNFSI